MKKEANSIEAYIFQLPTERKEVIEKLRVLIKENLPAGFEERLSYGMIGYVVPHSIFPAGYHCAPSLPLPFINLASQKNYIAIYHSGIYADQKLAEWFKKEYQQQTGKKPDMGKSCIRLKKMDGVPYDLIGELCQKMSVQDWIAIYKKQTKS